MIAVGAANRTRNFQTACTMGCVFNSSIVCFFVKTNPANIEINSAPIGIPIRLVNRSAKSKIVPPNTFTPDSTPNDKALGIPMMKMSKPIYPSCSFSAFSTLTNTG